MIKKLVFCVTTTAAAVALLAAPAQAKPDWGHYWHKYPSLQECEVQAEQFRSTGTRASACEYDGGDSWQFWT
ncbi:hypothetical protein [Nocardia salmonicida]|uniref:hypothetical protein n=1 Tax=Nocardia salmonicida TaxID=53431 RepID=UPI0007A46E00|nr:hypothetical protein [Nocardia salmonicida]